MGRSIGQDGREPAERSGSGRDVGRTDGREPQHRSAEPERQNAADLRKAIDEIAQDRLTMSEFVDRLERAGIRAIPSLQKSGRLNGMSYEANGHRVKGSELGRPYTALGLERRKGVQYDPERDKPRLEAAAQWAREHLAPPERTSPQARVKSDRLRDYDGLSPAQRAALREIGRFRTVLTEDLIRIQYRGDGGAWRQDYARLAAQKLAEQRSVVVATHSKSHGRIVRSLSVVVLTKTGKELLRRCDADAKASRQAFYAGFVKPREIAHDAAIYRMFQAEAARIEQEGGRVKRVVLDFELKKRTYSPLAKARALSALQYTRQQAQIARENGLKVVQGKIRFPDLRIEYETANGDAGRVDLELATEHYRGDHMTAKDRAGFKIYADSASFPSWGAGTSHGRSPALDEDHLIEIFSF